MTMNIHPLAGKLAPVTPVTSLVNVPRLITAYFSNRPDATVPAQRVAFGTSGHRGCAFDHSFNEWHVLAISQAICDYRREQGIDGPLFLGIDTHALSEPAYVSALEVMAANGVEVMLATHDEYTPTPVISHAILTCNQGRMTGLADGYRHHALAQSARQRRLQIQPAQRRTGRQRGHALDGNPGQHLAGG
ncbi:MAG: hypothetical protein WCP34_10015 [Pseudomonadota bacterium]